MTPPACYDARMKAASLAMFVTALAACGQAPEKPAPRAAPAVVASPAPAADAAVAPATEWVPGSYYVVSGIGLMQVKGPREYDGKPGVAFTNGRGTGFVIDLEHAKDPGAVRPVISKAEAEKRLALLLDTTPVTDKRSEQARSVEHNRTLARGTDEEQLALLRATYASTFAAPHYDMRIRFLEELVLPELAYVLEMTEDNLVAKLHSAHSIVGTFASNAKPRPPEPKWVPRKDPWRIKGHEYVGTFTLKGETLTAGDPIYVTSKHDETARDVTKNVTVPAAAGKWLCYLELDPKDPSDVTMSFIAIHESAKKQFDNARRESALAAKLWVDSGRMAVIDSSVRDDAAFDDARVFGGDDHGVIKGRGCLVTSGGGDGTYATRVIARDGKAIYIHVDFTGESRDFVQDARAKLKL